ncbi:hypothetical protein CP533_3861 [Ophiocordyceps camponoti-saundersi (nom. inval.)]|nr:hypothetical protein CP533_3861 [Ophiocordyceps camponoti-saundersi (nom. inval.)]
MNVANTADAALVLFESGGISVELLDYHLPVECYQPPANHITPLRFPQHQRIYEYASSDSPCTFSATTNRLAILLSLARPVAVPTARFEG